MKRTNIHTLAFTARCESGLHIGGSQEEVSIGGSDNPVIKNPANGEPYIPGSSLKGKMRSELEKTLGRFGRRGSSSGDTPCGCAENQCPICRIFGAHMNTRSELGPTRVIVRDGALITRDFHLENKTENTIGRERGTATNPRVNERVAAGTEFNMEIVLQVFDYDEQFTYSTHRGDEAFQAVLADCLNYVQSTGLGGGLSRGSGKVSFRNFELDGERWTHWSE